MTFQNIGRFVSPQTIDFESMSSICQIDGININTNGSSGSGKSTVFQALEFVLGVNEVPTTILQSRLTKNGISVELVLDKDGVEYTITRSKTDGLSIKAPEGTIEGSNKIAEEYLQKMMGIPVNLLRKVFHKRQNEGGFFIGLTPKESYEFLTETLDLTSWTKKQENISEKARTESTHLGLLENDLTVTTSKIEGINSVLNSLVAPAETVFDSTTVFDKTISDHELNLKELITQRNDELAALKAPVPVVVPQPDFTDLLADLSVAKSAFQKAISDQNDKKQSLNADLSALKIQQTAIKRAKADLLDVQSSLELLKSHIVSIKNSICPTCSQGWVTDQAQITLNQKVVEFKALMAKEDGLTATIATESSVDEKIMVVNSAIAGISPDSLKPFGDAVAEVEAKINFLQDFYQKELSNTNALFHSAVTDWSIEKGVIEKTWQSQIEHVEETISVAKEMRQKLETSKALYESQLRNYNDQQKSLSYSLMTLSYQKNDLEKALLIAKHKIKVLEVSEQSIKSYVNQLFQGALDQIAARANEILLSIPNTQTMSVSFEAFKETKGGAIKEEITTFVHCEGEVKVPLKSLSGGERTSVELAVDLAVVEMIETHTGKGLNVFIMDEPMTGLDSVSACALIDMLMMANLSKKIIIVDHNESTKSRVTNVINVVREGQESRLE